MERVARGADHTFLVADLDHLSEMDHATVWLMGGRPVVADERKLLRGDWRSTTPFKICAAGSMSRGRTKTRRASRVPAAT